MPKCDFNKLSCFATLLKSHFSIDVPEADLGLLEAVNYYHKELYLGCCSSPRFVSDVLL